MTTTCNCNFKVLRLECPALVNGAFYRVSYRRGNTTGTVTNLKSDSGVLTPNMEEASALLHFKPSGASHPRFSKKYITFIIEEAFSPRREIGTVEFDVAGCLQPGQNVPVVRQVGWMVGLVQASMCLWYCTLRAVRLLQSQGDQLTIEASETTPHCACCIHPPPVQLERLQQGWYCRVRMACCCCCPLRNPLKRGAPATTKYDAKLTEEALAKVYDLETAFKN